MRTPRPNRRGQSPGPSHSILTAPPDTPLSTTTGTTATTTTTRFAPPPAVVRTSPRLAARPPLSPLLGGKSPRLGPKHGRSASGARSAPPTPILSHAHSPALPPSELPAPADQPEFAELLTPVQAKRKRARVHGTLGTGLGTFAGLPVLEGPSRLGFTTHNGDLYRGAVADPNAGQEGEEDNEDALSVSSRTSTSSSWSWGSGNLGRGRRATMAVVHRVGEAIGVRRGSHSSNSSGASTSSTDSDSDDGATSRLSRFGRKLTRTMSRATDTSTDRPRRVYKPRRREFTLVLPPEPSALQAAEKLPEFMPFDVSTPGTPAESERVITTPVLPPILEAIRAARAQSGHGGVGNEPVMASSHNVPVRRGGSGPGRLRSAPAHPFAPPPVPRPSVPRTHTLSRVDALRSQAGGEAVVRPKSASDLLGLAAKPRSASDLLGLGGPELTTVPSPTSTVRDRPKASRPPWWLDVSCPTWKDLRDIGELLGLHPLTLEDVLHQDPREKLDTYDKLGYYFVVVRALDEQYFKYTPGSNTAPPGPPGSGLVPANDLAARRAATEAQKKERRRSGWGFGRSTGHLARKTGEKVEIVEDNPGKEGIEGVGVGGVNLYLVVFSDGIVTFHYDDVSKHTKRVLSRLLSDPRQGHSSDWIAHGLLDSIVDAFFPLAGYVDGAVDDLDALTVDPTQDPRDAPPTSHPNIEVASPADAPYAPHVEDGENEWIELQEKKAQIATAGLRNRAHKRTPTSRVLARTRAVTQAAVSHVHKPKLRRRPETYTQYVILGLTYLKLFFFPTASARRPHAAAHREDVFDRSVMLRSMTDMRRLVSGLSRLLHGKQSVVASMLKRAGESGNDVEAYLSDVNDHILLLQTSFYHYDYILSHCQPAYMSYLRVANALSRGSTDILILSLSVVTVGILPMQVLVGMFSMNVHLPANGDREHHRRADGSQAPFNIFGIIVAGTFVISCAVVLLIRYWRYRARCKWSQIRGVDVPEAWSVFWGWE
ncbi:hypothetical protein VHUM_02493 [Vanrija humicola]|uniref:Uncharacterized protein n=1 Tax=Vanrija humicola TaxID=5417 RepID=A0A7D8YYY1_VANHU|nr:hypothetical protein VHUM_02493 [Vanrija humicola]